MGCLTNLWITPSDEDYVDSTDLDLGSAAAIPVKVCAPDRASSNHFLPKFLCKQHATCVPLQSFKNIVYEDADANGHNVVKGYFSHGDRGSMYSREGRKVHTTC